MKLHRIDLEDERPKTILVEMTVDEAKHIAKWAGGFSPNTSPNYEATSGVYDTLISRFFNVFWYDGVDGALRGDDE